MTCEYCGNPTQLGLGTSKFKQRRFCSTSCIKANWRKHNKAKEVQSKKRWIQENPEKRKQASIKYQKANKEYYTEYASLYQRRVQQAKPRWADNLAIKDVYLEAEYFGLEVDHVIPLKHPLVCGLHVWDNLQLLSRSENAKKSNKFSVEDEDILATVE